ncbi:MAG TPA: DNA gyrase inhibitor YacG [Alphaproteobacteria bacterium]|nr:DNA gyrase inhibitor YacG [Alphaproteobacteria bacterium]
MADETRDDGKPPERPSAEVKEFRAAGRGKKCPVCGNPVNVTYRPFCSRRCADLDLGRWLREDYRIPAEQPPDGGEEAAARDSGASPEAD